jgi:hypothetical protein
VQRGQRRSDDSTPIAPLGKSDSDESFRLALLGRTPFGRSKVKLQWEVKPLGTPFDGSGLGQSANWLDTGTAGAALSELVDNLSADTAYHWRVRLHYHPASTPYQQYSRWLTVPWNGWQEQDLRILLPQLVADFSAQPLTGTLPLTVTFTNLSTPSQSITRAVWSYGDGVISSTLAASHTHAYTQAGVYTVTLSVSDGVLTDTCGRRGAGRRIVRLHLRPGRQSHRPDAHPDLDQRDYLYLRRCRPAGLLLR